ncbi:MFS transporter [Rothia dentocariosa]|uniref:MFS transporter n=1 Tax=Rothia dentocariosa TaxID=2047 RepID=UPI0028D32D76|nr:MFS transporter [Rothia dentocariosa]
MAEPAASKTHRSAPSMEQTAEKPWVAMWSLVIGFFMILLDTTIVTVALPHMQHELNASLSAVIWVTSAYLLAYAVPLLITGRLGDRFGQKQMYLLGMVVFTLSSLWCGLSPNVEMLIVARVVQGIGASIMTPQTMSIITLMFPPHKRGVAMSVWGAAAGIASLVGPIAGGLLVDGPGWTWIFFINIPIGVVGTYLAVRNIPHFPSKQHNFDWLGVVLSAIGLFLMVFGIQEGSTYDWGTITDSLWGTGIPVSVWGMIIAGIIVFTLFIVWQAVNRKEPLVPLGLFKDRNFSVSNIAIAAMGAHTLTMAFPTTIYFQQVRGMSPTQAALMTAPLALFSGALSPIIGKRLGTSNPKWYAVSGFALLVVGFVVLRALMTADQPLALLLIPFAILGIGNSMIWGPLAVTATRNLPPRLAGAGSGVYNETRQVAGVLGSAGIATLMGGLIADQIAQTMQRMRPSGAGGSAMNAPAVGGEGMSGGQVPDFLREPIATAMNDSLMLALVLAVVGMVACLFFAKPVDKGAWASGQNVSDAPSSENTSTKNSSTESPVETASAEEPEITGKSGSESFEDKAGTGSKP